MKNESRATSQQKKEIQNKTVNRNTTDAMNVMRKRFFRTARVPNLTVRLDFFQY